MDPNEERILRSKNSADAPTTIPQSSERANDDISGSRPRSRSGSSVAPDSLGSQRFRQLRGPGSPANKLNSDVSPSPASVSGASSAAYSRSSLPIDSIVFNLPSGRGPFAAGSHGQPSSIPGLSRLSDQGTVVPASESLGSLNGLQQSAPSFPQPRRSSMPNPILRRSPLQPHAPLSPSTNAAATPWHGRFSESSAPSPRMTQFSAEHNAYATPYKNIPVGPAHLAESFRSDLGFQRELMTNSNIEGEDHLTIFPTRRQTYPNDHVSSDMTPQKLSMMSPATGSLGVGHQRTSGPVSQGSSGRSWPSEINHAEGLNSERSGTGVPEIGSSSGSVSLSGTYGQVPLEDLLERAILDQDVNKVAKLLEEGHDPNRSGNATKCPLLIAAIASANERMVKTLLAAGADIEIKDSKRCSALHHATARGYRNIVKVLLVAGADLYVKTERGHLPVQLASDNRVHQLLASRMQAAMDNRIHQSQISLPDSPMSPRTPRLWSNRDFPSHHNAQVTVGPDQWTDDSCSTGGSSSTSSVDASVRHSRQSSAELCSPRTRAMIPLHFYEDSYSPQHSPRSPMARGLLRQESLSKLSHVETGERDPGQVEGKVLPAGELDNSQWLSVHQEPVGSQHEHSCDAKVINQKTYSPRKQIDPHKQLETQGFTGHLGIPGPPLEIREGSKELGSSLLIGGQLNMEVFSEEDEDTDDEYPSNSSMLKGGRFNVADTLMIPSWRLKSLRRGSADENARSMETKHSAAGEYLEPHKGLESSEEVQIESHSPVSGERVQDEAESSQQRDMNNPISVLKGDGKVKKERKSVTFASEPSAEDLASIREDWHEAARSGCVGCGKPGCGGQCLVRGKQHVGESEEGTATSIQPDPVATSTSSFKWTRGELLGEGAFGKVYAGLNQSTGELMAVKQLKLDKQLEGQESLASLEREIALYKKMRHKHIVGYINVEKDDGAGSIYIFLEYVSGGSMQSMLERFGCFSEPLVRVYTKQLLLGLEYLHANKIVHRDIKGGNVLVDADGVVKLADFGASKAFHDPTQTNGCQSIRGSVFWMAPEVIKGDGYGRRADIWSVGCTVIEMLTASHPWPGMDNTWTAIFHIAKASSGPPIPDDISDLGRSFLEECFKLDPKLRPTASELLLHPFVSLSSGPSEASTHPEWQQGMIAPQ